MLSIMIVDDEEVLHVLYGKLLEHKGHTVVASAFNGGEAAGIYRGLEPSPDLVLMDHRMPIKNGLEAMREILTIDAGARIVFLTADAGVAEEAMDLGAAEVLLKPFRMDVLLRTVEDAAGKVRD
ncbi:MAG: response regulator [Planctomycetes bacterium]|nr:response regulator [Planctomycetota bacterium]